MDARIKSGHVLGAIYMHPSRYMVALPALFLIGTANAQTGQAGFQSPSKNIACAYFDYDNQNTLWRFSEAPSINYYQVPTFWSTLETHHDLKSGRYICQGLDQEEQPYDFSFQTTPDNYSPQSLRNRGVR